MATHLENCPIIGTTNTTLPPSHPDIDFSQPGQRCPIVGATTDHHAHLLHKHPLVPIPADRRPSDASACPALKNRIVNSPHAREMDDSVCPIVGTATTVLPLDHPQLEGKEEEKECPITKAKVGHHKGKVTNHPDVSQAGEGRVCPVVHVHSKSEVGEELKKELPGA
ncbi:uncharacterized protein CTHT_0019290 [Thermochaetoides thermophila DSM 1495]|uniref:Uncharacterized protein n=1 Tax=Chaetomium thermophilum (strain DSM 1495 / CBS 144.50 / IMI 039719) TaxID=759272 RepID=G0S315_CHATD|nr:hypothetical protein CTHT_0019290 [Thermochaetoides thermophila DSM 1495]EGS22398.1 hypothetical protein CTHT_0019290 [Thermochaetoides thermophila DSM 1495]